MDITKLITDHGPALTQQLTGKAGFTADQAKAFLPLIAGKVMEVIKGGQFDIKSLLGGGDMSGLIGKLGIGGLAQKVGIDETKATAGAKAVVPGIIDSFSKQTGGLADLVGDATGGAGELVKKAGKMFGG
ncbi:MAG: hypothetical protein JNL28_16440 [Planctomycetes bacterium]|nr:hypothetical protein [Planctomycetota bacterium]